MTDWIEELQAEERALPDVHTEVGASLTVSSTFSTTSAR
jgi:hypothetical protein